ncbi:hypothetical protein ACFCZ1_36365 [Streptomyces sp. NPDC056224]|uniref:hypothetical protein n=1 Tax=Streptomyces sp. NPDC056224 TaxID=3345750 RepID=UPI0035E2E0D0
MTALPVGLPGLPAWETQVVAPSLIRAPGPVPMSIYIDDVWSLAPLVANPSATRPKLDWSRFPSPTRPQAQLAAWMMINTPLPASVLVGHPTWHSRLGPPGIHDTVLRWQRFMTWLHQQDLSTLHAVTDDVLTSWAGHLARQVGASRGKVTKDLVALTRLWAFDAAGPAPSGMAVPPWHRLGIDDFLPRAPGAGRGGNTTEAISPATMGPLLIWALRVVDDFADDILTAWSEGCRMAEAAVPTDLRQHRTHRPARRRSRAARAVPREASRLGSRARPARRTARTTRRAPSGPG